jgi:hypothetical protein
MAMTVYQHAAQLWSVLALAARNRQVLTYGMVGKLVNLPAVALGKSLEPLQSYCILNRLPPLTILVVNEETGLPGGGFIAAQNIPLAQLTVFAFDWPAHKAPDPETLEQAVRRLPSNANPEAAKEISN